MSNFRLSRRDFIRAGVDVGVAGAALTSGLWASPLFAKESFPTDPIDIVVPFGVGGGTDIWIRALGTALASKGNLNTPINVRNVPGAASLRGTAQGFQAKPNGYTLAAFNPPSTPWSWFLHQPPFDITKFRGISVYVREPAIIIANPGADFKDLKGLMAAYNAGDQTVMAAEQKGTVLNVAAILLKQRSNVNWKQYISYEGTADIIAAVLRNEVPVGIVTASSALDAVHDGRIKPLAIIGLTERIGAYPDVPTLNEMGMDPLSVCVLRRSIFAPPDIPEDRRKILEKAVIEAQDSHSAQIQYKSVGLEAAHGEGAEAEKAISDAIATAKEINLRSIAG